MQKAFTMILFCALIFQGVIPSFVFARVPSDPLFDDQWYLEQIHAPQAWDTTTGSRDVIIAVLDSGVDFEHEDLEENIWKNEKDIYGDKLDNDANGYIDDTWGYDFVLREGLPLPVVKGENIDIVSVLHGTVVSGIIGAVGNNGIGVAGVAWNVQILPVRALNENGDGDGRTIAESLHYAVDQGADIINLSFSGSINDDRIVEALHYAYDNGVTVVAAVGNEGRDINDEPAYPSCTPADTGEDWVIGVGASDMNDERAEFSNFGQECVDITAPGVDFVGVTYYNPPYGYDELYTSGWLGTSLSTPVVSGALGLILSNYPGFTPSQLKTILQLSADPMQGSERINMGAGRLNIEKALTVAGQLWEQTQKDVELDLDFVRVPSKSTVYALLADGTRRMVLDTNTFFTHANSFKEVRMITEEELAKHKLKGVLLPKAQRVLIKIQSDPLVYWLSQNGSDIFKPVLRAIPNEDIAKALFGEGWQDYVIDVDVTMFSTFTLGLSLEGTETVQTQYLIKRNDLIKL